MNEEMLKVEIDGLEKRRTELSNRLANAQAKKSAALVAIVASGTIDASTRAAGAEQESRALSDALACVNVHISGCQSRLAALHEKQRQERHLDQVADVARRASEKRDELDQTFVEGCAVLADLFEAVSELGHQVQEIRGVGLALLQQDIPDITAPISSQVWSAETSNRRENLFRQLSSVTSQMAIRGARLDAILTNYNPTAGGLKSEADTTHQFPDVPLKTEVVRLLADLRAEAGRRVKIG